MINMLSFVKEKGEDKIIKNYGSILYGLKFIHVSFNFF